MSFQKLDISIHKEKVVSGWIGEIVNITIPRIAFSGLLNLTDLPGDIGMSRLLD
jgi:hypothetical protein